MREVEQLAKPANKAGFCFLRVIFSLKDQRKILDGYQLKNPKSNSFIHKNKKTKGRKNKMKKMMIALMAVLITVALAGIGTYAYFSDTETSVGNTFGSGTMDFRIALPGDTDHRIFNVSNLKPGQEVAGYLAVVNDSTEGLDMKWKAWIPDFSNGILDNVLEVKVTMRPSLYTEYAAFTSAGYTIAGHEFVTQDWTSIQNLGIGNTILAWNYGYDAPAPAEPFRVKWAGIYEIAVRMNTAAGNDYQNTSFTGNLNFYATQCEANLF